MNKGSNSYKTSSEFRLVPSGHHPGSLTEWQEKRPSNCSVIHLRKGTLTQHISQNHPKNIWGCLKTNLAIFGGMNIHLPVIWGSLGYQGFDSYPYHVLYYCSTLKPFLCLPWRWSAILRSMACASFHAVCYDSDWLVVDLPLWRMMEWKSVGMMTKTQLNGKS